MFIKVPKLEFFSITVPYFKDPTIIFNQLCEKKPATLLLESADIQNNHNLKSFLIIDSALRITAFKNYVILHALSKNGYTILNVFDNFLSKNIKVKTTINKKILFFPKNNLSQDEDSRLKSICVLDVLRKVLIILNSSKNNLESIVLGGMFAYELVCNFEFLCKLKNNQHCPDYCFYLAETTLNIDHQKLNAYLQVNIFTTNINERNRLFDRMKQLNHILLQPFKSIPVKTIKNMNLNCNQNDKSYCKIILKMQKAIRNGEIFQVVPSRKFFLPCLSSLATYNILKITNPSPYMFFMQDYNFILFGSSPESSLKYNSDSRKIEIYPIAGTSPRGFNSKGKIDYDLDSRIELKMRNDKKELSEHLMLVDIARNDLSKICIPGSRYVANLMKVEKYSHVMHMVSRVVGTLREDLDIFHAYKACINMGTLSGAPKVRAMQLIAEVEKYRRGSYGGSIGYFTINGDFDSCIIIRSAYVENNIATVQTGAGIVLESNPQDEADESRNKARSVLNAIVKAHNCNNYKDLF